MTYLYFEQDMDTGAAKARITTGMTNYACPLCAVVVTPNVEHVCERPADVNALNRALSIIGGEKREKAKARGKRKNTAGGKGR